MEERAVGTAIGIRFVAGRYHALPWHRHVNEADVEWPPSPLRLLRALIAVWHRKANHDRFPEDRLAGLVKTLSRGVPVYRLPPAVLAHTRHFMPMRSGKSETRRLVFDAFLRVDSEDELVVAWPERALDENERDLLAHLVERLGYLGRAESWAEGRVIDTWEGTPNCVPEATAARWGVDTREHERVELPVPMPPDEYAAWAKEQIDRLELHRPKRKKEKLLRSTLPDDLLDVLRLDTGDWRSVGWSTAPGTRPAVWLRPRDCFVPDRGAAPPRIRAGTPATTVRFALLRAARERDGRRRLGPPLPLLLDAIKIGEAARAAAMSRADQVPPEISGHDVPWDEPHQHAFYLPEDADGDGRIDHLTIHAPAGLGSEALRGLDRIERLWLDSESEWRLILERYGVGTDFADHPYLSSARVWESVTPYLHPWYRKKSFTIEDQIRRELRERGLPEPALERLPTVRVGGRARRAVHFHRFRTRFRRGSSRSQPDTQGSFWRLVFPERQSGPIALGFACHYGLGVFRAAES